MPRKLTMDRFTPEQLANLRMRLEKRRSELIETEGDVEGEALKGFSEERTDEISHVRTHPADLGTNEAEQDVELSVAEDEIGELQDIEDALQRMQGGSYGRCEVCKQDIPFERLVAIPYARYCTRCESKHESVNERSWRAPEEKQQYRPR